MCANIHVFGKVQGVYYRKSTKTQADNLELVGWVRNRKDGSVEIMAYGKQATLEKLYTWTAKGPPMARVEQVNIVWRTIEDHSPEAILHKEFLVEATQ